MRMTPEDPDEPQPWINTDPLVAASDNAEAALRDLAAVGHAEGILALARHHDLLHHHHDMLDDIDAAQTALKAAQADGNPHRIAAAEAAYHQRRHKYDEIAGPLLTQMRSIIQSRLDHIAALVHAGHRHGKAYYAATGTVPDVNDPEFVAFRTQFISKLAWIETLLADIDKP